MRIFVIRKSGGLGDVICCEPVIRGLRKKHPHAEIIFGMPKEFLPLFQGRSEVTFKGYSAAEFTVHWMRKYWEMYDIVLDLCGPEAKDERDGSPACSRTESFCNFAGLPASCPEIRLSEEEKREAIEILNEHPKPWVGFGPNGTNWTRNWPQDRWEQLISGIPGTKFYFDKDKESTFADTVPFVGKSLREIAALISCLDLMISVDTGLLHLAGALGTKTFSLWGPSDPKRTLKHYPNAYYLDPVPNRDAVGCTEPCLYTPTLCLKETLSVSKCMGGIQADDVIAAVLDVLDGVSEQGPIKAESYETRVGIPEKGEKTRIVWAGKHLLPMIGGAERTTVELLKHLADDGYDVMAFWSHHQGGPFEHYNEEIRDGVLWGQVPPGALPSKMLEASPDVVLTQLSAAPHIANVVPKTVPLILFLHSIAEHFCENINSAICPDGSPVNLFECKGCDNESFMAMRDVYRSADEIVANSKIVARVFKKFTGREAKIQYPVVDGERCRSEKTNKRYCVAVGVTEHRGMSFLGQLARALPNEKFIWVGAAGGALPNVKIVERTEDLGEIFSNAFLNLTPHKIFQAFGRTPVEAGWAGIPTLTLDKGGLPEAVGKGGLVLDEIVADWRTTILELRKDREWWQELSDAARAHAESFNWDTIDEILEPHRKVSITIEERVMDNPLVSVVIPTHNRADLLPKAIDSALSQTYQNTEVVVVDGASTYETEKVCRGFGDKIIYVKQDENGNIANALNTGIEASKGDFVCWLADDNHFENKDKTKIQLKMFEKDGDLRLIHSEFVGSTVMMDRKIFKEIGLFNPGYRYCYDADMFARAQAHTKVATIRKPMISKRRQKDGEERDRKLFDKEKEMLAKHARMFGDHPSICAMICMKNEEKHIERCLYDLTQWVDSIVIFNDGSLDASPDIARSFPKVVEVWDSEPKGNVRTEGDDRQKMYEMAVATDPNWILFHDADERFENLMKWIVYDLIMDDTINLYYAHQVNLWRSLAKYRADEMWAKGWFPRLFRNLPGLKMQDEEEHCGGVPNNIPGATMFPSDNSPKGQSIEAQVIHYSFADWQDTVKKFMLLMERDPAHVDKKNVQRGGAEYYERIIDEQGLVLTDYEGDSVAAHMQRGEI